MARTIDVTETKYCYCWGLRYRIEATKGNQYLLRLKDSPKDECFVYGWMSISEVTLED